MKPFIVCILLVVTSCRIDQTSANRGDFADIQDPPIARINIASIYYTQNTINPNFTNGIHVKAVTRDLSNGTLSPQDLPPIRVIKYSNPETQEAVYFTLDNRRLYALKNSRYADADIEVKMATKEEVLDEYWKITSQNDGHFVTLTASPDKGLYPPEGSILHLLRTKIDSARANGC